MKTKIIDMEDGIIELRTSHPKEELAKWEKEAYDKGYAQAQKDFEKMIDECSKNKGSWYKYYVGIKELKAKLKEGDKT